MKVICKHEIEESSCYLCGPRSDAANPSCRLCPRRLTNSLSVELGVGPVCFQKDKAAKDHILALVTPNEGRMARWELPEAAAKEWATAFRSALDLHVTYRTNWKERGRARLYFRRKK